MVSLVAVPLAAETLEVPEDFSSIQRAIDAAEPGDVVLVAVGTYRENLVLRDSVSVRGVEASRTILIAADQSDPLVEADNVGNVVFRNFSLRGGDDGVFIINSRITLASNIFDSFSGTAVSVGLGLLSNVVIINNVFRNNNVAIDRLVTSASVTNNIFSGNDCTVTSSGLDGVVDPDFDVSFSCYFENGTSGSSCRGDGVGDNFQTGNPLFVDTVAGDYHLQQDSICIDAGSGLDVIDNTVADIGAYGGNFADLKPFPVAEPTATDSSSTNPASFNITIDWDANLGYLVTNDVTPGSYNVWYQLNEPGPPYEGQDAGNFTMPAPINVPTGTVYTLTDLQPGTTPTPGVPVLVSAAPQNTSVVLDWNAATDATSYNVYYGEADVTENVIGVGNVTSFTVTGLQNGTQYLFAVGAVAQPVYYLAVTALDNTTDPNESDFSEEVSVALGDPVEGMLSNELSAEPEEVVPYPDLPDKGCFVATAAFGADWVAEVQVLRAFRDTYLLPTVAGREFVDWYYRHGPIAAEFLHSHASLKPLVRAALWPLVALAAFLLGAGGWVKVWVAVLSAMLLLFVAWRSHLHALPREVGR